MVRELQLDIHDPDSRHRPDSKYILLNDDHLPNDMPNGGSRRPSKFTICCFSVSKTAYIFLAPIVKTAYAVTMSLSTAIVAGSKEEPGYPAEVGFGTSLVSNIFL